MYTPLYINLDSGRIAAKMPSEDCVAVPQNYCTMVAICNRSWCIHFQQELLYPLKIKHGLLENPPFPDSIFPDENLYLVRGYPSFFCAVCV
jgi:hypothetical protein